MSNFEKITATPEALGAFLAPLPVATGPWDESFHEKFCASCEREECDTEHCPHQNERNNPTWWLTQAAEGEPVERRYVWRNGRLNIEPGAVQTEQKLIVVRDGYETVLNGFLERMKDEREKRVEKTGDASFTEFEALMPELVRFILPDRKCRIVLEYNPAAPRVELRRDVTEEAQG